VISLKRLADWSLKAFFLTFPLLNVGLAIGGYPLPIPTCCLLVYECAILGQGCIRVRPTILFSAAAFAVWALAVTAFRYPLASFAPSLMMLMVLWVPFWLIRRDLDGLQNSSSWFVWGLIMCFVIAFYQLLTNLLPLSPLETIVPTIVAQRTAPVGRFSRLNALMVEPSFLAIYLAFAYMVLDRLWQGSPKARLLLKGGVLFFMAFTFSLSGIGVWLAYMGFKYLSLLRYRRWLKRILVTVAVVALLGLGFFAFMGWDTPARYVQYLQARLEKSLKVITTGDLTDNSSEGQRAGAISLAIYYVQHENPLWGEGYATSDDWISRHFVTTGYVHNIYSYLLISVGFVGLVLYVGFLVSLRLPLLGRDDPYHEAFFFAWLVTAMATGHLIFYYYWGYLYLLYFARLGRGPRPSLHN
jgi:O-antigen ligase